MSSTKPSTKGRSLICSLVIRSVSAMPGLYRITAAPANSIPIHANGKFEVDRYAGDDGRVTATNAFCFDEAPGQPVGDRLGPAIGGGLPLAPGIAKQSVRL